MSASDSRQVVLKIFYFSEPPSSVIKMVILILSGEITLTPLLSSSISSAWSSYLESTLGFPIEGLGL